MAGVGEGGKNCQHMEERETQDHSETVKKGAVLNPKQAVSPKANQQSTVALLMSPNKKNQPRNSRSRTKYNASLRPLSARPSVLCKNSPGAALKSQLSPRQSATRKSRSRSNAQDLKIEALRKEQAEMIRHDYFDDQAT